MTQLGIPWAFWTKPGQKAALANQLRPCDPSTQVCRGSAWVYPVLSFSLYLTSLAQYSISRLETTQVRSSRAVYETYEWNDALLILTPTLTPSQNRPHALCASHNIHVHVLHASTRMDVTLHNTNIATLYAFIKRRHNIHDK